MRKNFTPLLLIPGFIVFFACSKHESRPAAPPPPVDSLASNVYLDPGTVNAIVANDTFRSFNLIHASDTGGSVHILARALINKDTFSFTIDFADTLHTGIPYANYLYPDTPSIGSNTVNFTHGAIYFSLNFFADYLNIEYASNARNYINGDTLLITNFDKSKHLIAGTFKAFMTASQSESAYITQPISYVTGSFDTYYNTAK